MNGALGIFFLTRHECMVKRGSALVIESFDRLSKQKPRKAIALLTSLLELYGIHAHFKTAPLPPGLNLPTGKMVRAQADNAFDCPGNSHDNALLASLPRIRITWCIARIAQGLPVRAPRGESAHDPFPAPRAAGPSGVMRGLSARFTQIALIK